jgi:hypothetical protein
MRASPIAPAVPFSDHNRGHDRGEERARPIALSELASTPNANDVNKRDNPVAV